jgi:hypothetical protein
MGLGVGGVQHGKPRQAGWQAPGAGSWAEVWCRRHVLTCRVLLEEHFIEEANGAILHRIKRNKAGERAR